MSAFLSFPFADRIELFADGASCLPNGVLIAKTEKIRVSPFLPLAVVGRGGHRDIERMADLILKLAAVGTVDEVIEAVRESVDNVRVEGVDDKAPHFEFAIACFSEATGPRQFEIHSYAGGDLPEWTLNEQTGSLLGGGAYLTPEEVALLGLGPESLAAGATEAAIAIMEKMRTKSGRDETRADAQEAFWIGGHIDRAIISADGVAVDRVHEWPDQLFQRIVPSTIDLTGICDLNDDSIEILPNGRIVVSD
jgi:hypothetical protein